MNLYDMSFAIGIIKIIAIIVVFLYIILILYRSIRYSLKEEQCKMKNDEICFLQKKIEKTEDATELKKYQVQLGDLQDELQLLLKYKTDYFRKLRSNIVFLSLYIAVCLIAAYVWGRFVFGYTTKSVSSVIEDAENKTEQITIETSDILNLSNTVQGKIQDSGTETFSLPAVSIMTKRAEGDTTDSFCMITVVLDLDKENADYDKYGGDAAQNYVDLYKDILISIISQYTVDEIKLSQDAICDEVLKQIREKTGSDVVCDVSISDIAFEYD